MWTDVIPMTFQSLWTWTDQYLHKSDEPPKLQEAHKSDEPIQKQTRITSEQKENVSFAKIKATYRNNAQRRRPSKLTRSIDPNHCGNLTISPKVFKRNHLDNRNHAHKVIESTTTDHSNMRHRYTLHTLKKSKNRSMSTKMKNKMSHL
jgi:hypothetical protein